MSEIDNTNTETNSGHIIPVNIEDQMKSSYIDYSMSVIVSRALPDVRDGLKPVHRRVLFGMYELGVNSRSGYKKSARIVGEVLGKYHPHGDTSVYDAMVRMAQEWSLRYPMVDGQGNFGSVDGDSPAAMRYTEARLKKIAEEMLFDLDKGTVDFQLNFDDSLEEPIVLPAKIPYLLVNGTSGIAVGMATNMAPHNISEVCNGIIAYIDNREITIPELMKFIKAPDFPTGGIIYGYEGVKQAFETGRGRILIRCKSTFETEEDRDRERIIVTEIPYQVNKAELIKRTAELINEKKLEGIADIRDESDRNGMRIVYELKKEAIPNVVLNNLYQQTALQSSFNVNNICLVKGRPMLLNLKEIIVQYVEHRHDVVIRRTQFELNKALERAHILEGLLIALDHLDEVITLIRNSQTPDEAKTGLMTSFNLTEIQSKAILDLRLQRLTGLERDKIVQEYEELLKSIEDLKDILANEDRRMLIIKTELLEIKEKYGDEPRTDIVYSAEDFKIEDIIANEDVCVTISHMGYIKRTLLSEYKTQNRGGKGSRGSNIREEDFLEHLFVASMHNYMLFFTEKGKCFWMRVFEIPEGTKQSKGRAIQNLLNIAPDDKIKAFINVNNLSDEEYLNNNYIILCTKKGTIKKTFLKAYSRPRQNGINAININEGDQLLEAKLTNGNSEMMLAIKSGRSIRFNEAKVRPMGRNTSGVRGIRLSDSKTDEVVGMICVQNEEDTILVVSENGYGKRSKLDDYRITNRGGKGVKTLSVTSKTGSLIAIKNVVDSDDLMIITKNGIIIRIAVSSLRVIGRATQGVRLINLKDDSIAAVAKVEANAKEENSDIESDESIIVKDVSPEDILEPVEEEPVEEEIEEIDDNEDAEDLNEDENEEN
ncbi:MAG: DNA gyrase subunit A [Bacteroidota bacterium]|nr:DNA gyrase subunit A [Bacteroidota bacterium]